MKASWGLLQVAMKSSGFGPLGKFRYLGLGQEASMVADRRKGISLSAKNLSQRKWVWCSLSVLRVGTGCFCIIYQRWGFIRLFWILEENIACEISTEDFCGDKAEGFNWERAWMYWKQNKMKTEVQEADSCCCPHLCSWPELRFPEMQLAAFCSSRISGLSNSPDTPQVGWRGVVWLSAYLGTKLCFSQWKLPLNHVSFSFISCVLLR